MGAGATADRDERVSQLIGRKFVDAQGQALAQITDFAVDPAAGRILYAMVTTAAGAPSAIALPIRDLTRNGDAFAVPAGAAAFAAPPASAGGKRLSEVMKRALVDYRGKEVGKLRDVVVNLVTGKVHYAVAEFDPSWVAAGQVVTIRMPREDGKVELNALMGAMIFDQKAWPDINHPQFIANIDAYLGKQ
jgi:sporulation protein YlmC with PRC-barrel domain